jgi:predicted Co/Zn/Cd cation transporter (cation efflux family)
LEVVVAFVGFFLAFLVLRVSWLWSVLECSPELVALLGGVVAVQMPQALLLQQVLEAAGGLL